jgi:hypothetical protein
MFSTLYKQGDYDEADTKWINRALSIRRKKNILDTQGRGEDSLGQSFRSRWARLGRDHPNTWSKTWSLALMPFFEKSPKILLRRAGRQ